MKKFLSLVLAFIMILTLIPVCYAQNADELYPTVMVPGYGSASLFMETPDGDKQIWGVNFNDIMSEVLANIADIGIGLGELALGKADYIADTVGKGFLDLYGCLACNPDSTSVNAIHTWSDDPALTNYAYLNQEQEGNFAYEPEIMATVAGLYPENGEALCFSFQTDFRQSITDCAADLDRYIDKVLAYTGAEKVNLFAVSHGGEICAVYLSEYGVKKNAVHNAVLTVPAIGGAALAYDLVSGTAELDEETLLWFIENGMMFEEDYNWLVRANQLGILDDIIHRLVSEYVLKVLGYWGSIWDFIPAEYYEELKAEHLDSVESAELIKASDYYHNSLLPNMSKALSECNDNDIHVYIVAGTDHPSVTGLQQQSDAIIPVSSATGAYCAPYTKRFNDGYQTLNTVCKDSSHNHLSPAMNIDASCGYLPEQTWYISGLFHGMTWKDDYTVSLCCELLIADELVNVYSYTEYPQFFYSTNRCYTVTAQFSHADYGFITGESDTLTVSNLSKKYPLQIISVDCQGTNVSIQSGCHILKPGESVSLPVQGSFEQTSLTTVNVTVYYKLIGSVTPYGSRTLAFTLNNGNAPVFNADNPFVDAEYTSAFDTMVSEQISGLLELFGILDWFKMMFNALVAAFTQ